MKTSSTPTPLEQIGGMQALDTAVEIFYAKVLEDDTINHFFRWTSMPSQTAKQKAFLAYILGTPHRYSGKGIQKAHAHLVESGLNEVHFDTILRHLLASLHELGVSEELLVEIKKIVESFRDDVLGR